MDLHQRPNRIVNVSVSDSYRSTIRVRTSPCRCPLARGGAFDEAEFPTVVVLDIDNDSWTSVSADPNRRQYIDDLNGILGACRPGGIIRVELPDGANGTLADDEEMLHSWICFFVNGTNDIGNHNFC